ncbi:MAG: GNAT family N-acetyltransferase [Planctomycetota bacterium]|jgi:GNAT superfamily N-acetyltransferase
MSFTIRAYRPADLAAVKEIAADTAYFGRPVDNVFPRRSGRSAEERTRADRDLVADALIMPYAEFEPDSFSVAEADGRVVGYVTGCLDTDRLDRSFRRRILPGLALRLVRGNWRRLRGLRLVTMARIGRRRSRVMREVVPDYPAHCHVNVARGFRGSGIGRAVLGRFVELARESGTRGVHASVASEGGRRLAVGMGFVTLARVPVHDIAGGPPREGWIMGLRLAGQDATRAALS